MDQNQEALPNRQVGDRAGNDLLESGSSSNKPRWPVQVRIVGLSKTDDGDNAHWSVTLADVDEPITVTSGVLLSFNRFRARLLRERGVILERLTHARVDPDARFRALHFSEWGRK
jgi:hypothetical protein